MDSPWTWALFGLTVVAMVLSYRVPRAWWWITAGGASFLVSTAFLDYGGNPEYHPILALSCDALVCLALFKYYQEDWELGIFVAFLASVFTNVLKIGGFIQIDWAYAALLELCNLGALICISGTGIVDMLGRRHHSALRHFSARLHSPRNSL